MSYANLEFHRDGQQTARAVWPGEDVAGTLLAQFFEAELAADTAYLEQLRIEAQKHRKGAGEEWKTSGNSFSVTISSGKVTLRPLFGLHQHHACMIDLPEFLKLLAQWKAIAH
jgi:hypothetical protein